MSTSTSKSINTPFPEAVCVIPVSGSSSLFTANVPKDWCGTPAAHGGYLQALIFSTARTYFLTHHLSRNQPDPITAHTQFLKQVWHGPVKLAVKPVNLGSRVSVIQIELSQLTSLFASQNSKSNSQSKEFFIGVIATVTQGNLATEKGISLPTVPTLRKEDIPDRETECEDYVFSPFIKKFVPASCKLDGRAVRGGVEGTFSDYHGRSFREVWYTFADGSAWDVLSLGYLTDMFGGAPNNYAPQNIDYAAGIIYPTLSMVTEIKKDPKGSKWLFMKVRAHEIKNGRFDTEVTVVDEGGELVALSRHVSLALVRKSPEEIKRIYRL